MSALFTPIHLRDLELPNRIAVAPMCQYVSREGMMHDWHLMHYGQLSMGAGALMMTEATHVSSIGRITPGCAGLWNDEQEAAVKRIVDFAREYGTSHLGMQIAHAGRKASCNTPLNGNQPLSADEGAWQTVGPSALPYGPDWHTPSALDEAGMAEIKSQFVDTTKRAERIGFDVIEMHAAHGYLLNQFLSPLSNQRDNGYGGTLEKRMRFPLEVFAAMRAVWPQNKPLGVRVSAIDWVDGGTTIEDTIAFAKEVEALGCDFIDVSSAGLDYRQKITTGPGYQVGFASAIKQHVSMPVIAVGMITQPTQAEAIIADGDADMVMLARGMLDDPHWSWHAAGELGAEVVYPPQYIRASPKYWRTDRKA
ncbi:MAG: NADH:flavin oxidoreductase/NADH oxidase [Hyphomicrobiales bacterium]